MNVAIVLGKILLKLVVNAEIIIIATLRNLCVKRVSKQSSKGVLAYTMSVLVMLIGVIQRSKFYTEDKMDFKEADMFAPLKGFFEEQGFAVKGEIKGLDMALERDGALWGVEMKKSFNMTLIYQTLKRQRSVSAMFVAIPREAFMRNRGDVLHILEKLSIGLVTVAMDSPMRIVECHLLPNMPKTRNTKQAKAMIAEFNGRNFDAGIGGTNNTKLMTAYRERALHIAVALDICGQSSAAKLVRNFACYEKTLNILRINTYGWFDKVEKGIYTLSSDGKTALNDPNYSKIVDFYRGKINGYYE